MSGADGTTSSVGSEAAVFRASDYGLRPGDGGDATPVANRMLRDAARAEGRARIVFEAGRYDFWPDRACERYCTISNNTNGPKRIAFPVIDMDGLEIDGGGARFVFHGIVCPFILHHSRDVTIRRLGIDWERPFYTQARILDSDAERVDLEFDEAFPHEVVGERLYCMGEGWRTNHLKSSIEFDPALGGPAYMARDYYEMSNNVRAVALDARRVRLFGGFDGHKVQKAAGSRPSYGTPRAGNYLIMKSDVARAAPGIAINACADVALEDIDLYHACGMGVIAEKSRDLRLFRVRARVPENSGRMVSLNADALHFVNCAGHVEVTECVSDRQLDDALNIHGNYAFVTGFRGDRAVELGLTHHEQIGFDFCGVGDRLEFHHRESLRVLGEATVERVEVINGCYREVVLDRAMGGILGDAPAVAENASWSADLTARGCRSERNRGRGFLIKSRGTVRIEGNRFSNGGSAIVAEGKTFGFCESGPVRDLLIEDNDFVDCKRGPWGRAVIDVRPVPGEIDPGAPHYHRNVRIRGNRFRTFDPGIVAAFCLDGLEIADNRIERTETFPPKEESMAHSFALHWVKDAKVRGNLAEGEAGETPWIADHPTLETLEDEANELGPRETDPRTLKGIGLTEEHFGDV